MGTGVTFKALLGAPEPHWLWALAMLRGMLPISDWVQAFLTTSVSYSGTGHSTAGWMAHRCYFGHLPQKHHFMSPLGSMLTFVSLGRTEAAEKQNQHVYYAASDGVIETVTLYIRSMIWGIKKNPTAEIYQITNIFSQYEEKKATLSSKFQHIPLAQSCQFVYT